MGPEIILKYIDDAGSERRVEVQSRRFTIGRIPDNDLMIADSSLSRRHAVIETFDSVVQISDCGSQNGTLVNGVPVVGGVELRDGDVITLGGAHDITAVVRPGALDQSMGGDASSHSMYAQHQNGAPADYQAPSAPAWSSAPSGLSVPLIATAGVLGVLLVAALLFVVFRGQGTSTSKRGFTRETVKTQEANAGDDNPSAAAAAQSSPTETRGESQPGAGSTSSDPASDASDETERSALNVLRGISKDNNPVLSQKAVAAITERVKKYQGSSGLRDALRAAKRGAPEVAGAAKSGGVKPSLMLLAALARVQRNGGRGDPVQVAQALAPAVSRLREKFGDALASDSLLIIAALEDGPGLQSKIINLSKRVPESPAAIRSVWYLYDHQALSEAAYDLVVSSLAIGVVAQNPHKFGIDAEPLVLQ
jgi:hypothetical protein